MRKFSLMKLLTEAQSKALHFSRSYAHSKKEKSKETIKQIMAMANFPLQEYECIVSNLERESRIALHFHPDRLVYKNKTTLASILESNRYCSQYETNISNGGLSAHAGGERNIWEKSLFGDSYKNASPRDFPKYGALDLRMYSEGPASRFGSCYFLLRPHILPYTTFSFLDSNTDPAGRAVQGNWDCLLAELLKEVHISDYALGWQNIRCPEFLRYLRDFKNNDCPFEIFLKKSNLNHYIEAQVHCDINISEDVETMIYDPSFKGSSVEAALKNYARKYGIKLKMHRGFSLVPKEVREDFRGPFIALLAKEHLFSDLLTAYNIGQAETQIDQLQSKYPEQDMKQQLKYLWHSLVKFGSPIIEK